MSDNFFDHSIEKDMFYCHTCGKHSEDMDDEEYELHINSKPTKIPPIPEGSNKLGEDK